MDPIARDGASTPASAAAAALARVGRHRVAGAGAPLAVDRSTWPALRPALSDDRLTGIAVAMLEAGDLRLASDHARELRRLDGLWVDRRCRTEALLLDVTRVLSAAGVPTRVLKGPALASLDWRFGEERRWVDVDVLVPGERIDECVSLLVATGATRHRREIAPGFDRRFAKSVTMRSADGCEIDVHRALVLGPHSFVVPTSDLWRDPRSFVLGDVELLAMSCDATLVHACMHATIAGASRIGSLLDVLEVFDGCDPDRAATIAERWRAGAAVHLAGEAVAARLRLDDHPFVLWSAGLPVAARDRRLVHVYAPDRRTTRNLFLASVPHVPGPRAKIAFVRSMVAVSGAGGLRRVRSLATRLSRSRTTGGAGSG